MGKVHLLDSLTTFNDDKKSIMMEANSILMIVDFFNKDHLTMIDAFVKSIQDVIDIYYKHIGILSLRERNRFENELLDFYQNEIKIYISIMEKAIEKLLTHHKRIICGEYNIPFLSISINTKDGKLRIEDVVVHEYDFKKEDKYSFFHALLTEDTTDELKGFIRKNEQAYSNAVRVFNEVKKDKKYDRFLIKEKSKYTDSKIFITICNDCLTSRDDLNIYMLCSNVTEQNIKEKLDKFLEDNKSSIDHVNARNVLEKCKKIGTKLRVKSKYITPNFVRGNIFDIQEGKYGVEHRYLLKDYQAITSTLLKIKAMYFTKDIECSQLVFNNKNYCILVGTIEEENVEIYSIRWNGMSARISFVKGGKKTSTRFKRKILRKYSLHENMGKKIQEFFQQLSS